MFFSQRRFCSRESGVRQSESSDLRLQVGAGRGGAGRRSRLGGWPAGLGVEGGMIGDWRRDSGHWGGDPEVCEIILRRLFYFETWSRCIVSSSVWIRVQLGSDGDQVKGRTVNAPLLVDWVLLVLGSSRIEITKTQTRPGSDGCPAQEKQVPRNAGEKPDIRKEQNRFASLRLVSQRHTHVWGTSIMCKKASSSLFLLPPSSAHAASLLYTLTLDPKMTRHGIRQ